MSGQTTIGERPTVSVVIPTYNRKSILPRAIDSVLAQRFRPHEVIVVDDGSTDGTAPWLHKTYPGITVLEQENYGVSAARNAAIGIATGDWVAFLDSDDSWHPDKLRVQANALRETPDAVLIHCDEIWVRNGKRVNAMAKHSKHGGWIFEKCLPLCAISPSAAMLHRKLFAEVGTFDESLPACEDYDLWLRICCRYPVHFIPDALVTKYGGHADQLSKKHWGMDRFRIQSLEQLLTDPGLPEEYRQAALDTLLGKIRVYLGGARKRQKLEEVALYERKLQRWAPQRGTTEVA